MFLFFTAAILGVVAVFIFAVAPQARAYAVGAVATGTGNADSYDFGNSFQTLISPFTKFMNDLNFSSNTTINIHGETSGFPVVNLTPVVESDVQGTVSRWLSRARMDAWIGAGGGELVTGTISLNEQ